MFYSGFYMGKTLGWVLISLYVLYTVVQGLVLWLD